MNAVLSQKEIRYKVLKSGKSLSTFARERGLNANRFRDAAYGVELKVEVAQKIMDTLGLKKIKFVPDVDSFKE